VLIGCVNSCPFESTNARPNLLSVGIIFISVMVVFHPPPAAICGIQIFSKGSERASRTETFSAAGHTIASVQKKHVEKNFIGEGHANNLHSETL
jgi:hypothetical protein